MGAWVNGAELDLAKCASRRFRLQVFHDQPAGGWSQPATLLVETPRVEEHQLLPQTILPQVLGLAQWTVFELGA